MLQAEEEVGVLHACKVHARCRLFWGGEVPPFHGHSTVWATWSDIWRLRFLKAKSRQGSDPGL